MHESREPPPDFSILSFKWNAGSPHLGSAPARSSASSLLATITARAPAC